MGEYIEKEILDRLVLACIHCGFCLQSCPTYRVLGYEPDSPRGRLYLIKSLLENRVGPEESVLEHLYKCIVCRGCETACPSGIKYGFIMDSMRSQISKSHEFSFIKKLELSIGAKFLISHIDFLRFIMSVIRLSQKIGIDRLVRHMPKPLNELDYLMPSLPTSKIHYSKIPEIIRPDSKRRARVGFLHGCLMEAALPWVNRAMIHVLLANGYEVITPRNQTCCGAAPLHEGFIEYAKKLARRNIDIFERADVDYVLSSASGCVATLKMYDELLKNDSKYENKAKEFKNKVKDFSELFFENGFDKNFGELDLKVTFHDSCSLAHAQKITKQPRIILNSIPGLKLVEMKDSDLCCGAGGLNWILYPEITRETLGMKLQNAKATNASVVLVSNIPCYLNISRGVRRLKLDMKVAHYVELLDEAYRKAKAYSEKTE